MKKIVSKFMPICISILLVIISVLVLSAGSCAFTTEGITLLTGDYSAPKLTDFTLKSENTASISFSDNVSFPSLEYYSVAENTGEDAVLLGEVMQISSIANENEIEYSLEFPKDLSASTKYILSGTVKDEIGSTLSFTVGYKGYNSRVPKMIFSEINTEYSKKKTEFIEFYILEDGNLAGVLLQSASDGSEKDYYFPSVEVKKGDYVVLHMRTVEDTAVSELSENVSLSISVHSNALSRDIFIPGKETRLSNNDVLILRKRLNGDIIDSVAYRDGEKTKWAKNECVVFLQEAVESQKWGGTIDIQDAIDIQNITGTRTLCRQNINEIVELYNNGISDYPNTKDNWIIVATSNLSPGKENSTKEHVK